MKNTLLFVAFLAGIFVFSMTSISNSQLLPAPIAYLFFNSTPNDVSGNENHGTVIGNTIFTEYIRFF